MGETETALGEFLGRHGNHAPQRWFTTNQPAILDDAGLADPDVAEDEVPAGDVIVVKSPLEEEYRRLCGIRTGTGGQGTRFGQPRTTVDILRLGSARRAVLLRSEGHCENPHCTGEPQDITDAGHPILEVDHVQLRHELFAVATQRHQAILSR